MSALYQLLTVNHIITDIDDVVAWVVELWRWKQANKFIAVLQRLSKRNCNSLFTGQELRKIAKVPTEILTRSLTTYCHGQLGRL